jgi:hypothetical protein
LIFTFQKVMFWSLCFRNNLVLAARLLQVAVRWQLLLLLYGGAAATA